MAQSLETIMAAVHHSKLMRKSGTMARQRSQLASFPSIPAGTHRQFANGLLLIGVAVAVWGLTTNIAASHSLGFLAVTAFSSAALRNSQPSSLRSQKGIASNSATSRLSVERSLAMPRRLLAGLAGFGALNLRCWRSRDRHSSLVSQGRQSATGVATEQKDSVMVLDRFMFWRTLTFTGMVLGYATYYLTRLSFTYVGPVMRQEMGLSMLQLGAISSIFPLAYMNSKFISGVLSDLLNSPTKIFGVGLMFTGVLNIAFGLGHTVPWFTGIWVLNGLFQGCGATPCNKMLVNWFPARNRGRWWSGWNASHNLGGFIVPLLAGGMAATFGWRYGMFAPGIIALVVGFVCLCFMRDSPEKLGLPSAEDYNIRETSAGKGDSSDSKVEQLPDPAANESVWKVLLSNRFLWCMAAMHFFIYFIRQGVLNWAHFYIMDEFGVPAAEATMRVSGFELGGLLGCIISGQLSDKLIERNPSAGAAGLRTQVMVGFSLLSAAAVAGLWLLPPLAVLQWTSMFVFGFAIYGPQTLITMAGVETVPPRAAATAGGLLAYPAQFGAMFAGLPFALLVQRFGWRGFFPSLVVLSIVSALVILPGCNEKSYEQRRKAAQS